MLGAAGIMNGHPLPLQAGSWWAGGIPSLDPCPALVSSAQFAELGWLRPVGAAGEWVCGLCGQLL